MFLCFYTLACLFFVIMLQMDKVKKNVLIISNSGNRGGMEVHVLNLLEGLSEDFNLFVVCPKGNIVSEYEEYAKVINISPKIDVDPFYILRLIRLIKILDIDVVHTHELKAGINGLIASSIAKTPLKISHQHTPISNWQINALKKKLDVFVYTMFVNLLSSFEIALTEEIKKQKMIEGIKEKKLVVIPNGVDLKALRMSDKVREENRGEVCERYGINERSLILGNISRLTVEKGHFLLIKALRELKNDGKLANVKILIAGDGDLKDEIVRMVKSYDLSDRVVFTGFVSEEDKFKILSSLDVFVFPTLAEGFGIVLIEAMSFGVPCVVSDLPVLKDVALDSVFYFESGNEKDLEEKISKIVADKSFRSSLSGKSTARVKKYDIKNFWESYNNLYENTLSVTS